MNAGPEMIYTFIDGFLVRGRYLLARSLAVSASRAEVPH